MSCVNKIEHVVLSVATGTSSSSQDLTGGQTLVQCVPMFVTTEIDEDSATYDARGICTMFKVEVYDNAGTPAVRATRSYTGYNVAAEVSVYIVEFIDDINIYSGTFSSSSDTINETVTAVTLSKAFVVCTMYNTQNTTYDEDHTRRVQLSSTTNIEIARNASGNGTTYGAWYVVEDSTASTHFNVQHGLDNIAGAGTGSIYTFSTAVDMSKSFILCTHRANSNGSSKHEPRYSSVRYSLYSTTQIRTYRNSQDLYTTCDMALQLIELEADDVEVVRGYNSMSSTTTTENYSLGSTYSVNCAAHLGVYNSYYSGCEVNSNSTEFYASSQVRTQIDSGRDGVDVIRNVNQSTSTVEYNWEAVDFGVNFQRRIFIT